MGLPRQGETIAQWNERRIAEMLAQKPRTISIAANGTWSALFHPVQDGTSTTHSITQSYEKLDYHTGCRQFLEALRDAGIPIVEHGSIKL